MQAFLSALLSKIGLEVIVKLANALIDYLKARTELAKSEKALKKKLKEIQNEKLPTGITKREAALLRAKRINDLISGLV